MAQPDMSDHPESRHLLDFVARLGETDEGGLFRHLLSCPACSKVALELIENQRRGLDWGNVLSFHPVVDRAASRLETVWRERWSDAEADRQGCEARLAELLAAPPGRRAELLARDGRLRVWAVADRALETAAASLTEEPRRALEIARVGLQVTASLDAGFYGERLLADLELRALALVGEAHRRLGDLDAAEEEAEGWAGGRASMPS